MHWRGALAWRIGVVHQLIECSCMSGGIPDSQKSHAKAFLSGMEYRLVVLFHYSTALSDTYTKLSADRELKRYALGIRNTKEGHWGKMRYIWTSHVCICIRSRGLQSCLRTIIRCRKKRGTITNDSTHIRSTEMILLTYIINFHPASNLSLVSPSP